MLAQIHHTRSKISDLFYERTGLPKPKHYGKYYITFIYVDPPAPPTLLYIWPDQTLNIDTGTGEGYFPTVEAAIQVLRAASISYIVNSRMYHPDGVEYAEKDFENLTIQEYEALKEATKAVGFKNEIEIEPTDKELEEIEKTACSVPNIAKDPRGDTRQAYCQAKHLRTETKFDAEDQDEIEDEIEDPWDEENDGPEYEEDGEEDEDEDPYDQDEDPDNPYGANFDPDSDKDTV